MPSFIDEYLVRLGTHVDVAQFAQFSNALKEAGAAFDGTALGMARAALKAQVAVVGAFAAVGSAVIGLVDKIAMADQEYQLFALHMFMSKDAARGLKVAMDVLGQPLENLTWYPELRKRTIQLLQDQRRMAPEADFEMNMHRIRDIRFEFTRMEVELQYLSMNVVNRFLRALGTGPDQLLKKLREFNDWVITHMPEISAKVVRWFLPIWKDIELVLKDTVRIAKDLGAAFTSIVGLLSGDSSMVNATFSFEKFADAVQRLVHWMALAFDFTSKFFGLITGTLSGGAVGGLIGSIVGGAAGIPGGPAGIAAGALSGGLLGTGIGAAGGAAVGGAFDLWRNLDQPNQNQLDSSVDPDLWRRLAAGTGGVVSKEALQALAWAESGPLGMRARSAKGAIGIMQLMPETAASYGLDPNDQMSNLRMGTTYLMELMKHYGGNLPEAIGAYNAGPGRMDQFLAGKATLPSESRNEIAKVLGLMGQRGTVQVGSVQITIIPPAGVDAQAIANRVKATLQDQGAKRTQRNLAEFQGLSWSYGQ